MVSFSSMALAPASKLQTTKPKTCSVEECMTLVFCKSILLNECYSMINSSILAI